MCLAMPGKIVNFVDDDKSVALVDFLGLRREVNVSLLNEPTIGTYLLVHVGYAIQQLDPEDALESLDEWKKMTAEERAALGY